MHTYLHTLPYERAFTWRHLISVPGFCLAGLGLPLIFRKLPASCLHVFRKTCMLFPITYKGWMPFYKNSIQTIHRMPKPLLFTLVCIFHA